MHRLAMALGMTISEIKARMTHSELVDWMAYYKLEPFGPDADNWRAGLVSATVANVNRGKNRKAYKPTDFMPRRKQTPGEVSSDIKRIFSEGFEKQ